MIEVWYASYVLLGLIAGFLGGLLGIGGGIVMVPVLMMIFTAQSFSPEHVMHLALGTSMAGIIFSSLASARTHHAHGAVRWLVVRNITPGIFLGAMLGTRVASLIPTRELVIFFGCFVLFIALQMFLKFKPKPGRELPGALGQASVGLGIGGLSALVAIGGGSLTVPWLLRCNLTIQQAIGSSAAIGLPIAVFGSAGYIWNGYGASGLPAWSLGFIYLPALLCMLVASTLAAPFGARLAHRMPVALLKQVFAVLLIAMAMKMLWSVI